MKFFLFTIFFGSHIYAVAKTACDLPIFYIASAGATPLQREAEDVLSLRGFDLQRRTSADFAKAHLADFELFATTRTNLGSTTSAQDCVMREFEDLGKFYTCSFEFRLYVYSPQATKFVEAVHVEAATRDTRSTDGFYESVRDQLNLLPTCIDF